MKRFITLLLIMAAQVQAQSPAPTRNDITADDGHHLILWSKAPTTSPRGEIILLHGRTWSARPNFDLQVNGQHVSLMDAFVERGYAVYALDQRGYGATARDRSGWLTPERAAHDAELITDWVASRAPSHRRPALLGYSRGSATAMLAAQRHAEKVSALVLYGFYFDVESPPAVPDEPLKPAREHTTVEGAGEDFLTPASTPRGVKEAYVRSATTLDPIRVDWRHEEQFNALHPSKLHVPTLVISGEGDPYAKGAGLPNFLGLLDGIDRSWIILAQADHVAHLERQPEFVRSILDFLETPHVKR